MQLNRLLAFFLVSVTAVLGFSVKQPHIAFTTSKKRSLALNPISKDFQKLKNEVIIGQSNETIELNFAIDTAEKPDIATLILAADEHGVEVALKPLIKDNQGGVSMYRFKIAVEKLPDSLVHFAIAEEEPLTAYLILANQDGNDENLFLQLLDFKFTFTSEKEISLPKRFGPLPEIHHIFHTDPSSVSPWFAQAFSLIVIGCVAVLALSWLASVSFDIRKLTNSVYPLGFVGCLIALEYVFFQYYLGSSIFKTLKDTFFIVGPGIWLGSKLLNRLS